MKQTQIHTLAILAVVISTSHSAAMSQIANGLSGSRKKEEPRLVPPASLDAIAVERGKPNRSEDEGSSSDTDGLQEVRYRDANRFVVSNGDNRFEAWLVGDVYFGSHAWKGWEEQDGWRMSFYGSSTIRLRMKRQPSSPVRTPSFEPKVTFQFIRLVKWDAQHKGAKRSWIINAVPVGHHSNGQDGCTLMHQSRSGDDCVGDTGFNPENPELNRESGSFSTNYSRLGIYHSAIWPDRRRELVLGLEMERHHHRDWGLPGSLSPELYDRYGNFRLSGNLRFVRESCCTRMEARYWYQWIMGIADSFRREDDPSIHVHVLDLALYLQSKPDLGLYARYYKGRDYYNIHFEEALSRIEMGLTFTWHGIVGGLPPVAR